MTAVGESVDVLAAQVRAEIFHSTPEPCSGCAADVALDALVARVTEAEHEIAVLEAAGTATAALWEGAYERERAALADARNALEDAHEFQCGCDRPGNPSACVAEPREAFEVLARLDGSSDGDE